MHRMQLVRENNGLTRRELSVLSEICPTTIYRIESGDTTFNINVETAQSLADTLCVKVEELFSPFELSHLGRPPHTGKRLTLRPARLNQVCPGCFLQLPATGICDNACGVSATG
jgi:DNA-binding XRE family transcriptional regulator